MSGMATSSNLSSPTAMTAPTVAAMNNNNNINGGGGGSSSGSGSVRVADMSSQPYITTTGGSNLRPKPRPLELTINSHIGVATGLRPSDRHVSMAASGGSGGQATKDEIPICEILDLIERINRAVRANEFSAYLGSQILRLVMHLKKYGLSLESSYQHELNQVFVSLRQACCRDAGHLGTVCRMEMMELIELRAMGWQPNLSHSRYYMKRSCGSITTADTNNVDYAKLADIDPFPTAPESAPPFGTVTINPFAFNLTNGAHIASTADLSNLHNTPAVTGPTPYFLIPASPITHNQAGIAFISPTTNMLTQSVGASPLAKAMYQTQQQQQQQASPTVTLNSGCAQKMTTTMAAAAAAAAKVTTPKSNRSSKTALKTACRAEIVIRNSDSGKVMGVKGRRVAVIEEMSNTIVSFQKVTPSSKDRMITINGPSEDALKCAKKLIEETIRRNMSPDRINKTTNGQVSPSAGADQSPSSVGDNDQVEKTKPVPDNESEVEIVTGENGEMLKLISPNPELLQTAYKALDFYFRSKRNNTTSEAVSDAQGRNGASKINRRKSLSSLVDSNAGRVMKLALCSAKYTLSESDKEYTEGALAVAKDYRCHQSTPNLAKAGDDSSSDVDSEPNADSGDGLSAVDDNKPVALRVASGKNRLSYSLQDFIGIALAAEVVPSAVSLDVGVIDQGKEISNEQPIDLKKLLQLMDPAVEE